MQMRGTSSIVVAVAVIAAVVTLPGCGCSEKNLHGDADSDTDAPDGLGDTDGDIISDASCPTCDDGDPCTVDTCDTGTSTCTNEPYDGDDDGYPGTLAPDGTTVCPGTDCDDDDPLTHPGAEEICMDWIDEDCDTIADGPKAMLSTVHLKTLDSGALNPTVTWTGSEFVAAWDDYGFPPTTPEIFMARVDMAGELVGGEVFQVTDHSGTLYGGIWPKVEWTGSEIGLLYTSGNPLIADSVSYDVELLRLDPEGTPIASEVRLNDVDTIATADTFAWTGSEYAVLWKDGRDGPCPDLSTCETDVFFARVSGDGVEAGPDVRISAVPTGAAMSIWHGNPLWTGSEFLVFWAGGGVGYLTRLDADGVRVGSDVVVEHPSTCTAWTGSAIALSWESDLSGNMEVFLSQLDPEGTESGTAVRVTDAPHFSGRGMLAWTGSQMGLAWIDGRDTACDEGPNTPFACDYDIYFNVLDAEGTKLWDDVKVNIRESWSPWTQLIWTGSEFGLVWMEGTEEGDFEVAVSFDRVSFCE